MLPIEKIIQLKDQETITWWLTYNKLLHESKT